MSTTDKAKEFATISSLILANVRASHPIRINLDMNEVMYAMGVDSPTDPLPSDLMFKEMFRATLDWLLQEQFVCSYLGRCPEPHIDDQRSRSNERGAEKSGLVDCQAIEEAKPGAGSDDGRNRFVSMVS